MIFYYKATADESIKAGHSILLYTDPETGLYRARLRRDGDGFRSGYFTVSPRDVHEGEKFDGRVDTNKVPI